MKRRAGYLIAFLAIWNGQFEPTLNAQDKAKSSDTAEQVVDDVSRQAMQLETELSKFQATTPEAADVMVRLADVYHANQRVFGLIRVTQRFVNAHPQDTHHADMMLKLIDGLEAVARNKEVTAACRQFLAHYPAAPQCAEIEVRLADALQQMPNEYDATGDACRAVWVRQPQTDLGKRYAMLAMTYYAAYNDKNVYSRAAMLAEQMLDSMPVDAYLDAMTWQGVAQWRWELAR